MARFKKVGLMGGTFDPPHIGHLEIAKKAVKQLELDLLLFLPTGKPPHKNSDDISKPICRLNMVEMLVKMNPIFKLGAYDFNKKEKCFTYETVQYYSQKFNLGKESLFFIIGGDSLKDFQEWVKPEIIINHCTIACSPREGFGTVDGLPSYIELNMKPVNISSTQIRKTVLANGLLEELTLPSIIEYIKENNLYKESI